MDPDDAAYRRSVRNMSMILAAMAIIIFAAIFVSPYVFPAQDTFQESASLDSPFGFTLHLQINATSVPPGGGIHVAGWLNSSSGSIANLTAADAWGVGPAGLVTNGCQVGWPVGVGVMEGHYTEDNFTLGTLVSIQETSVQCLAQPAAPSYFLLAAHSSRALVDLGGTPEYWVLQSNLSLGAAKLPAGVYTAVLADEWGDVVTTNFTVS